MLLTNAHHNMEEKICRYLFFTTTLTFFPCSVFVFSVVSWYRGQETGLRVEGGGPLCHCW